MRDARRNIACPRAALLTRGGPLLTSGMAQGELNRRTLINPREGFFFCFFFTRDWISSELNTCLYAELCRCCVRQLFTFNSKSFATEVKVKRIIWHNARLIIHGVLDISRTKSSRVQSGFTPRLGMLSSQVSKRSDPFFHASFPHIWLKVTREYLTARPLLTTFTHNNNN